MPKQQSPLVYGLVRPAVDAHSLGIRAIADLLDECGCRAVIADEEVCGALCNLENRAHVETLERWVRSNGISALGLSYRLNPADGVRTLGALIARCQDRGLLAEDGGPIRRLFFAGLPAACDSVRRAYGDRVAVFMGDEQPAEALVRLGVPPERIPPILASEHPYDSARDAWARALIESGMHHSIRPVNRAGSPEYGTPHDGLVARVMYGARAGLPPLMRAHVGPYLPEREQAVRMFLEWCSALAETGLLDVLSVGTSQLTQERFGEPWGDLPNGGGVPIATAEEYRQVRRAAHPMLVRTYSGTRRVDELAPLHEEALGNAWHALSFWWFCQLDGRGPNGLRENLEQHFRVLRHAARSGVPVEPNVPHHFAFRGADDITYVVSGVLAARSIRACGVRWLVLQTMLNTPRQTWGVQDLAKCRALLELVRRECGPEFGVVLQPRAGLDYLSNDLEKAKVQLASASALMDDIEPSDPASPQVVHVVSYSEGSHLATPEVVNESVQITRAAIDAWRKARERGDVPDMANDAEVRERTECLKAGAEAVLRAMEQSVPALYSPRGLELAFRAGFLPVPGLWGNREAYPEATRWRTRILSGGVQAVDSAGRPVPPAERARHAAECVRALLATGSPS
jgi:hypothetical protein